MAVPSPTLPPFAERMIRTKLKAYFHTLMKHIRRQYPLDLLLTDLRTLIAMALPLHHPWLVYCRMVLLYYLQTDTQMLLRNGAHRLGLHLTADVVTLYRRFSAAYFPPPVTLDALVADAQKQFPLDPSYSDLLLQLVHDPHVEHILSRHRIAGGIWTIVTHFALPSPTLRELSGWALCGRSTIYALRHLFTSLLPSEVELITKEKKEVLLGFRTVSPTGMIVYRHHEITLDPQYAHHRVALYYNSSLQSLRVYSGEQFLHQIPYLQPKIFHRKIHKDGKFTFHYSSYPIDARYVGKTIELQVLPSGDAFEVYLREKNLGQYHLKNMR